MPILVAIFDWTHVGSGTAFINDLVTVAQENSMKQTTEVLVEGQLQPPSRSRNSCTGEFHEIKSRSLGRGSATVSFKDV